MGNLKWVVLVCVIALLGFTGCSDDDDFILNFNEEDFEEGWQDFAPALGDFLADLDPYNVFLGDGRICQSVDCEGGSGSCQPRKGAFDYTLISCGFSDVELGVSGTITGELTYSDQLGGPEGERVILLNVPGMGQVRMDMSFEQQGFFADIHNPVTDEYLFTCEAFFNTAPCCDVVKTNCFFFDD